MKAPSNTGPTNAFLASNSVHPLLEKLRHTGMQGVETMEAFFVDFDTSYRPEMEDRQKLCRFVMQLQALLSGRPPTIFSGEKFTRAEWTTLSRLERALIASLIYFASAQRKIKPRAVGICGIASLAGTYTCPRYSPTEKCIEHSCRNSPLRYISDFVGAIK